jgi:hypothetical protein
VRLDNQLDLCQLRPGQAAISDQLDFRFQPKFRFAIPTIHMDVHSGLFAREEEKPIAFLSEYGWTHGTSFPVSNFLLFVLSCQMPVKR